MGSHWKISAVGVCYHGNVHHGLSVKWWWKLAQVAKYLIGKHRSASEKPLTPVLSRGHCIQTSNKIKHAMSLDETKLYFLLASQTGDTVWLGKALSHIEKRQ